MPWFFRKFKEASVAPHRNKWVEASRLLRMSGTLYGCGAEWCVAQRGNAQPSGAGVFKKVLLCGPDPGSAQDAHEVQMRDARGLLRFVF